MDLTQRIYFADNTLSTLDLEFLVQPNFEETVKFSQRIFPPTPFPTTFILELFRVAYFGFVDLTQRIYFADNALSTFDLEFLGEPNFGRQSSFAEDQPTPFRQQLVCRQADNS